MARERRIRGLSNTQWMESTDNTPFFVQTVEWDQAGSFQCIAADLDLAAGVGSSTDDPVYIAALMANLIAGVRPDSAGGAATSVNLTATRNIVAGVVAKYDHTGTNASTYPGAALIAELGDGSTAAVAAVLAVVGGDTGAVEARAMFGVDWQNTITTSRTLYGLDLQGETHDSYIRPRYNRGYIRMGGRYPNAGVLETVTDLCILAGTAAPTDGASGTGAGEAGPGSLYIRQSGANSVLYINTNTLASPTWTIVGSQS